jgi:hypothetical protein
MTKVFSVQLPSGGFMNDVCRWRLLADSFPCLARMVAVERIPANYTPKTLIDLSRHDALSTSERSVFSFLLHVWNQYEFSFTLSDTLIWDTGNRKAFIFWANGRTLGEPLRYF